METGTGLRDWSAQSQNAEKSKPTVPGTVPSNRVILKLALSPKKENF